MARRPGAIGTLLVLATVLVGCGRAEGGDDPGPATTGATDSEVADGAEGTDVSDVTEQPAEGVDLTVVLERTVVGGDPAVRIAVQVANRRDVDVAVVRPSIGEFTTAEDGTIVVRADAAGLGGVPIGDVDDGAGDAPPSVPGVLVAAGDEADLEVAVTAIPDQPRAVEVCLEVQGGSTGGSSGDEVPLTDTAPDGVRELVCGHADVPTR